MDFSSSDNGAGDSSRIALFSVLIDQIGKFAFWKLIDQIRSGATRTLIHAHIERTVGEKAQPPLWTVQLSRRHAEIKDHAVNLRHADRHQVLLECAEIPLTQTHARCETRQPLSSCGNRIRVAIDSNQNATGTAPLKNERRMAALPDRAIKVRSARLPDQPFHHFPGENRNMADQTISF